MLVNRLPDGAVRTDSETLRERAIDSWTLALLRRARGDELPVPAAVVFPASTEEVATVLAWASQTATAVITRGGGSGVCGGAQADAGSVVLDLTRMNKITGIDQVSQVAHVQAGVRGDQLEDALAGHGLTAGHYPQSLAISTVGGWIAASSAGQASTGFGAIEDVLLGLTAVLPQGEILRCLPVPRSAAGPDLRRLLVGSEGTLAVVTEATLACRGLAGWLGLAGLRLPRIRGPRHRAQGHPAGRDRRRRPARVRRDRRPAWLRGARPPRRVRRAGRVPGRPAGPGRQEARGRRDVQASRGLGRARRRVRGALVAAPQRRREHVRPDHGARARVRPGGDRGHHGGGRAVVRRPAAVPRHQGGPGRARAGGRAATCPTCTRPARRCTSRS